MALPFAITTSSAPITSRRSLGALPSSSDLPLATGMVPRHSSPGLLPSAGQPTTDLAESALLRTQLRIAGLATQDAHCVYLLEVDTGVGHAPHVLPKRYSEIRDFRAQLLAIIGDKKTHCGHGPCTQLSQLAQVKFPRRQLRLPGLSAARREADVDVAHQRAALLDRFLQAVLRVYRLSSRRLLRVCTNARCVVLDVIQQFLDVTPEALAASRPLECELRATMDPEHMASRLQLAKVLLPGDAHSFPELAHSTLCRDGPAPLFPIDEAPESVA